MLAPDVITRIRDTIAAESGPRDRAFTGSLRSGQNRLAARGMIGSGNAVIDFEKIAGDELDVRTHIVWYAIRRAYLSLVGTPTDTMQTDLELQLNEHTHTQKKCVVDLALGSVRIPPDQVGHFRRSPQPVGATQAWRRMRRRVFFVVVTAIATGLIALVFALLR